MKTRFPVLVLLLLFLLPGCAPSAAPPISLEEVPPYTDQPYVVINGNQPYFTDEDFTANSFETYSALDALNRCGPAFANVGQDLMPVEERGSIGQIKPSGWVTAKYDFVDGKYLYNRCHLIGFQLTGENANEKNLITGTRYLNVEGMLPFENMVADYVKETDNHVLYRVTPVFDGTNLVADGVLMEALSVEDQGEGVTFCVYVYNVQPGVEIDYATGESWEAGQAPDSTPSTMTYIGNTGSKKFHLPTCANLPAEQNRTSFDSREAALDEGYSPCGTCKP